MREAYRTDVTAVGTEYDGYRIPAIVCMPDGRLAAAFECRELPHSDWSARAIGVRTSEDGGKSWSALATPAASRTRCINNPVLIADGGTLLLLYCVDYETLYMLRSGDGGRTWGAAREIAEINGFRARYDFNVFAAGPGHGVRMANGRLVVPCWMAKSPVAAIPRAHHPSAAGLLYSDDRAETWRCGDLIDGGETFPDINETAAAPAGGGLYLNLRHTGAHRRRAWAYSPDGARVGPPRYDEALPDPICFASCASAGGTLFHVGCASERARERLTLRASGNGGASWLRDVVLQRRAGYADVALSPDGHTAYVLTERDQRPEDGFPAALTCIAVDV